MTTRTSSDKARQLREKQATELADANKMEQQRLKCVAKKKECNRLRKVKEDARKQREEDKHCKKEEAAAVCRPSHLKRNLWKLINPVQV